eukprot:TRINITY_DN532_c0_g1_i4.p1 TRINITY_DN532_c0_g1~~TRINITY_DN532_c0_g1_i4.p1  ORF type:complete len:199 (+),score=35.02 TRINITY_DN532_c0_g1_i4:87-683(+)
MALKILESFKIGTSTIFLAAGSILDYEGDAFVNAANEGCTGGFGVDEQVNKSGGYDLKVARKQLGGCPTGQAKVTESFDHKKVKHIIHAVGPVYRVPFGLNREEDHSDLLKEKDIHLVDAYKNSLVCAQQLGVKKLGFCLLSAGVFRGQRDLKDILQIGLTSITDNLYEGLEEVTMVAWTDEEQEILKNLFQQHQQKI